MLTTGRCNLSCKYCGGSFPPSIVPWDIKYEVDDLVRFLEEDDEAIVAFYGGEPLLNPRFIREVMDKVHWARFVIQANGLLIKALEPGYWRRFNAVLLSIDGVKEVTERYRGPGTYDAVLRAAAWLRSAGFKGDLIARMVASELTDIARDVLHLLSLGLFDHVHWQLNVVWCKRWDVEKWCRDSYYPGLRKLASVWLRKARKGEVLGIAPFKALLYSLVTGKPLDRPPCGAGSTAYAISTDGRVLACPIAVYEDWAVCGHISCDTPSTLKKVGIGEPCTSCEHFNLCGGRCLYTHIERLWGEEGFKLVCDMTVTLLKVLTEAAENVRELIKEGIIRLEELKYPPFNNTVEIIP